MPTKVCKFGGSSLADASRIARLRDILADDPDRRYVIPSAPGKRHDDDQKITDLLYLCHEHARQSVPFEEVFALIADRYREIVRELGLDLDLEHELDAIKANIARQARENGRPDYAASRGEYLNALVIARMLEIPCLDAAELIFFDKRGRLDEPWTYETIARVLGEHQRAVIPGFYGLGADGLVRTFSRGGSDVSGAIVARGVNAQLYENWTDVSGLLMADPRVVPDPRTIDKLTYRELRELSYMGATVLHDEAIFPVRQAGIPVNIRNTAEPEHPGTMIVPEMDPGVHTGGITGIAGRRDFTIIGIEKALMNTEIGFGRRVLNVLEDYDISFEHLPSGIDTMSLVISDEQLNGKLDDLMGSLEREIEPDAMDVETEIALIATVGRGMKHTPGMASRLFTALSDANVSVHIIDQGSSELNIIVGIKAQAFDRAMRAIYNAFVIPAGLPEGNQPALKQSLD